MPKKWMHDYSIIPKDFPRANLLDEVLVNYQMCRELVDGVLDEITKEQLRSPFIPTSDLVERHMELAKQHGWGCSSGEIEWVFRNIVRELGCEMPDLLICDGQEEEK